MTTKRGFSRFGNPILRTATNLPHHKRGLQPPVCTAIWTENPAVDVCPGPDPKGRTLDRMEYWVAEQDAMKFAESLALLGRRWGFRGLQVSTLCPGTEAAPASFPISWTAADDGRREECLHTHGIPGSGIGRLGKVLWAGLDFVSCPYRIHLVHAYQTETPSHNHHAICLRA